MTKVFGIFFAFCTCGMALAQSDTTLVPNQPISVSFEDLAVVKIVDVDSKPNVAVAKFSQKATVTSMTVREVTYLQEKRKKTVTIDGKQVEQEYTVQVPVYTDKPKTVNNFTPDRQERFCPVSGVQVFDLKGKLIEPAVWGKLLDKPRHVLLLKDPVGEKNPIDPFYMSVIREDTLLVFLPRQDADSKTK